jgi:hypothetical protein
MASGALHGAAVSDPKPITLSGPPSAEEMKGEAEKLIYWSALPPRSADNKGLTSTKKQVAR